MNTLNMKSGKGKIMNKRTVAKAKGFTLIEVMIALAVLTIGLTGLAAMHLTSLQYVHSSHYRSLASTIAMDFEERLWLRLADNGLSGCPDVNEASVDELAAHWDRESVGDGDWTWSNANMLQIRDLEITPGEPVIGAAVVEIPLTFSWSESRFRDVESDDPDIVPLESFTYTVRIQCRPVAA